MRWRSAPDSGGLACRSAPTGTYSFTYDNMDRLTVATTSYSFLTTGPFTVQYGYDAASNRKTMTDPQNASTTYGYDVLNRLNSLGFNGQSFGFAYDALSRRTSLTRPNGVTTSYSYDAGSNLLSVLHKKGNTTLDGATYTYDLANNRLSKQDNRSSTTTSYTYDHIYQLLTAKQGTTTKESYTYDVVGNRLSSLGVSPYTYNSSNELTSLPSGSYTYDNNGNTKTKPDGTQYTWNFDNRLTQVVLPGSGGTVNFKYDPFGRRIQKSSPLGTTNYLYDGDDLIEETDSSGSILARYTYGARIDEPLSALRAGTTSYYQQDGISSITSLTNLTGALANSYTFDSFGQLTAHSGTLVNPLQYTGRESDSESGLYSYRARYYDPLVGRFISEDPINYGGHDINLFRYVRNRPVRYSDPFGLVSIDPSFNPNCLSNLERALTLIRAFSVPRCNGCFRRIGDRRTLTELLDDPRIKIVSESSDDVNSNGDTETGFMYPGDKWHIHIRPYTCRMGRWELAQTIVHELTHQTLTPAAGQEDAAGQMEQNCGFKIHVMPQSITVVAP